MGACHYDRFKGSRKANVEVHGGATLEEITVPIIEITYNPGKVEVHILPVAETYVDFNATPEIEVSFRKKAAVGSTFQQLYLMLTFELMGKYMKHNRRSQTISM